MSNRKSIETQLESFGFSTDYIARAFKIYEKHYGFPYNVDVITEIIIRLQKKDKDQLKPGNNIKTKISKTKHPSPFILHMTLEDVSKLSVGDKIDHRDSVGRFILSTIMDKNGTNLKIHYEGWSRTWDIWSDYTDELPRFAHPHSVSKRASHRLPQLNIGIGINPTLTHPGWKRSEIRRMDPNSGQIQVAYDHEDGKKYLYWAHLDNAEEIATTLQMITKEIESVNWRLNVIFERDAVYCCFAQEIYGDIAQKDKVKHDCDVYMDKNVSFYGKYGIKSREAIIVALSELYNVRVRIFEYDVRLHMCFDCEEYEGSIDLPLVLLVRIDHCKYGVIDDPSAVHKRPLNTAETRANGVSLRGMRIKYNKESILGKRKLSDMNDNDCNMNIPPSKRIKLSYDNDHKELEEKYNVLKQQSVEKDKELKELKNKLENVEFKESKLNTMNFEELNRLECVTQNNLRMIGRAEKELIDNTLKCIACVDRRKNITFDGCNHCVLCDQCEASLQSKLCPICQTPYINAKKISI